MPASRRGVRGAASARAAGAGHVSADTTGARSLSRCRTSGVATPTATAPHASMRRGRVDRKALGSIAPCMDEEPGRGRRTALTTMKIRRVLIPALVLVIAIPVAAWASTPSGGVSRPDEQANGTGLQHHRRRRRLRFRRGVHRRCAPAPGAERPRPPGRTRTASPPHRAPAPPRSPRRPRPRAVPRSPSPTSRPTTAATSRATRPTTKAIRPPARRPARRRSPPAAAAVARRHSASCLTPASSWPRSRRCGMALLLTGTALARGVRARRPKTLR